MRLLAVIRATIPNMPAFDPRQTATAWHAILGDLPFPVVLEATQAILALQEIPTCPAVGKIRREAVARMGPPRPTAAEAWASVEREIRRVGSYGRPTFEDPVTARVVHAIGWTTLCASEDIGVERGHFLRLYQELAQEAACEAALPEPLRRRPLPAPGTGGDGVGRTGGPKRLADSLADALAGLPADTASSA